MYIIDRFEGSWAVIECEDRSTFNLPVSLLPPGAKEGDAVNIAVTIDQEAAKKIRDNSKKLLKGFFDR